MTKFISPGGTGKIDLAAYLKGVFGSVSKLGDNSMFTHSIEFTPYDPCLQGSNDIILLFLEKDHNKAQELLDPISRGQLSQLRVQVFVQPFMFTQETKSHAMKLRWYHIPDRNKTTNPEEADKFNSLQYVPPQIQQLTLPIIPTPYRTPPIQIQYQIPIHPEPEITQIKPGQGVDINQMKTVRPDGSAYPQGQYGKKY
ncbi:MAG: hypothetical protein EZS28_037599 [Streblomastix strix]|uniref:Uncharacterized protein n=1 Tax=Streblomastix strix TaxID=222440 RepID=A0A5J4U9N1_9EUKA|nr:MAG: hypothetical protein EZS28_037599 [Streblomastix strix]